jgi:hypothetical protein
MSNGLVGDVYLFRELTRFVWRVEDLIVKDREVERQTQPDRVRRLHLAFAYVERLLIGLLRLIHNTLGTGRHQTLLHTFTSFPVITTINPPKMITYL